MKHAWRTYGDRDNLFPEAIDIFAFEEGHHNGPVCKDCGFGGCHHCDRDIYERDDCPGPPGGQKG